MVGERMMQPSSVEILPPVQANSRLQQIGARRQPSKSHPDGWVYYSGPTGYWLVVGGHDGVNYKLQYFTACPCTS